MSKLIAALLLLPLIGHAQTTTYIAGQMSYLGNTRSYTVAKPSNLPQTPALVVVLQGRKTSSGPPAPSWYGWDYTARQNGFLVVAPMATQTGTVWQWNAFDFCGLGVFKSCPDDSGYLLALISTLSAQYNVDPKMVFVVGFSSGAHMAYRMCVEHGDVVAACAVNSGLLETGYADTDIPANIPPIVGNPGILHYHGTLDTTSGGVNPCSGVWSKNHTIPAATVDGSFDTLAAQLGLTEDPSGPLCVNGVLQQTVKTASDASGVRMKFVSGPWAHAYQTQFNGSTWAQFKMWAKP